MKCPKCEQIDSRVKKTYLMAEGKVCYGDVKARLRECRVCGKNYYSYEIHEDVFMRLNLTESRPLRRQPLAGRASSSGDSKRLVERLEKRLKTTNTKKKKKKKRKSS